MPSEEILGLVVNINNTLFPLLLPYGKYKYYFVNALLSFKLFSERILTINPYI